MKNRLIGSLLLTFLLLCTSCSGVEKEDVSRENSSSTLGADETLSDNLSQNEEPEQNEMPVESEEIAMGGEYTPCSEHTISYHYINVDLMRYVGEEQFDIWYENCTPYDEYGRATENMTISAFVDYFDVPREVFEEIVDEWASEERLQALEMTREEYLAENGYTDEQIDAIYSGDQSQINEAFCGDLAYYNPSDGQLYSIYWLSDHTAADYQAAGVPVSEVERILEDASAMGGSYASLSEAAAPAAEAYALE